MALEGELIDVHESYNEQGYLKRSCRQRNKEETETEEYSDLEIESGEITDDPDSDKDYDPMNKPRKKKKKKVKLKLKTTEKEHRRPKLKKKQNFTPPSFDQVMRSQISHLAKFIEYDDEYDSYEEASSINEEFYAPEKVQKRQKTPTPELEPPKERKKRVVIYPWRPIGITGGDAGVEETYLQLRKPVSDVRLLVELESQY